MAMGSGFVLPLVLIGYIFQNSNQFQIQRNSTNNNNNWAHIIRTRQVPQGAVKTVPDYIRQYGYPAEIHEVTTADGYILTMIRIPFGRNKDAPRIKAILFHHGIISDCSEWIINEPDKLLILQLADLGYDVWLANDRGTRYSRKHIKYTVKDKAFFDYSIDEMGKYDVPAEIDYIINTTGFQKIQYIGHSMGGLLFHIAMCNWPEYNNKISLMIGVAPAVYNTHMTGILGLILNLPIGPLVDIVIGGLAYGTGQFPATFLIHILQLPIMSICGFRPISPFCKLFLDISVGATYSYANNYGKYLTTQPSPTSLNALRQFFQMIKSNNFEHYDYGRTKNIKVYGSVKPPLYYLNYTTAPVGVIYGKTDSLVPPKDISRLVSELPNCVYVRGIGPGRKGSHVDFVLASDANEIFNKHVINLLNRY